MYFVEQERESIAQKIYAKKLKEWILYSGIRTDKTLTLKTKNDQELITKFKQWAKTQNNDFFVFSQYYPMDDDVRDILEHDNIIKPYEELTKKDVIPHVENFILSPLSQIGQLLTSLKGEKTITLTVLIPDENNEMFINSHIFKCDCYDRIDKEDVLLEGLFLALKFTGSIVIRQTTPLTIKTTEGQKETFRLFGAVIQENHIIGLTKEELKNSYSYDSRTGEPIEIEKGDYMMDWKTQNSSFDFEQFLNNHYFEETDDFLDPRNKSYLI